LGGIAILCLHRQEGASKGYTWDDIARASPVLQKRGNWIFSHVGANQGLSVIPRRFQIPAHDMLYYAASKVGIDSMTVSNQAAIRNFTQARGAGLKCSADLYAGDANSFGNSAGGSESVGELQITVDSKDTSTTDGDNGT
jgi:hypothetical protein